MVICLWSLIFLEWLRSPQDFWCSVSEPNCADFISQFLKYLKYLNISFSFHLLKWNQPQIHWIMELINGRIPLMHLCVKGGGQGGVCVWEGGGVYAHWFFTLSLLVLTKWSFRTPLGSNEWLCPCLYFIFLWQGWGGGHCIGVIN